MSYHALNATTEGRPCPHMAKRCPGTAKGCAFWRTQEVLIEDKPKIVANCLFVLQFEATYQAVAEAIRTQASVQHFNNQVHATVLALRRGAPIPALSGNAPRDAETLRMLQDNPANGGPR